MPEFPVSNPNTSQDAAKAKKGSSQRPGAKQKGMHTVSGISGSTEASGGGGPSPPGTTSFVGEANDPMVVDEPAATLSGQGPHGSEATSTSATGKDSGQLGKRVRDSGREDIAESENEPDDESDDGHSGRRRRSTEAGGSDGDGEGGGDRASGYDGETQQGESDDRGAQSRARTTSGHYAYPPRVFRAQAFRGI